MTVKAFAKKFGMDEDSMIEFFKDNGYFKNDGTPKIKFVNDGTFDEDGNILSSKVLKSKVEEYLENSKKKKTSKKSTTSKTEVKKTPSKKSKSISYYDLLEELGMEEEEFCSILLEYGYVKSEDDPSWTKKARKELLEEDSEEMITSKGKKIIEECIEEYNSNNEDNDSDEEDEDEDEDSDVDSEEDSDVDSEEDEDSDDDSDEDEDDSEDDEDDEDSEDEDEEDSDSVEDKSDDFEIELDFKTLKETVEEFEFKNAKEVNELIEVLNAKIESPNKEGRYKGWLITKKGDKISAVKKGEKPLTVSASKGNIRKMIDKVEDED